MRPPAQYVALRDIPNAPGSYAFAARAGDELTEVARANLRLTVGVDVTPLSRDAMERPADDASRAEWQNYAVVRGVPYDEAVNLDREELLNRRELSDDDTEAPSAGALPADNARKAEWVEYAVVQIVRDTAGAVPADEARFRAEGATKAELIGAFGPDGTADDRAPFTTAPGTADDAGAVTGPGDVVGG